MSGLMPHIPLQIGVATMSSASHISNQRNSLYLLENSLEEANRLLNFYRGLFFKIWSSGSCYHRKVDYFMRIPDYSSN